MEKKESPDFAAFAKYRLLLRAWIIVYMIAMVLTANHLDDLYSAMCFAFGPIVSKDVFVGFIALSAMGGMLFSAYASVWISKKTKMACPFCGYLIGTDARKSPQKIFNGLCPKCGNNLTHV